MGWNRLEKAGIVWNRLEQARIRWNRLKIGWNRLDYWNGLE